MCKCGLCFCVTGHEADYALTFGKDELVLEVCRYCFEDLTLLGFGANRLVCLEASKHVRRIPLGLLVLGPVYSLLLEAES